MVTDNPRSASSSYNVLGQLSTVPDYNFIGVGPRTDVLTGAYSYDNGARLTGLSYTSNGGGTTIDTLGWGYDAASNVTSFTSIDGEADYGYDATDQLTSATYTTAPGGHQPANENLSFDANGNRTMAGYATGSDNLLTSDGTFNYQHDADGNTTVRTKISTNYATDYRTTYSWDYRNRLTDVEYYDNNSVLTKHVHFVYGVFDHLLATEVDSNGSGQYDSVQRYVLDVSPDTPMAGVPGTALAQPVLEFDGNENLIQRNLVALDPAAVDAVLAEEAVTSVSQAGLVTWIADDNLGSPVDVADNSGAEADHIVYSSFGQVAYQSNIAAAPWDGFGGGHLDPNTGLVNNDHRFYDPATGRWLSEDPAGFRSGDTNPLRYVANAPVGRLDPDGLAEESPLGPPFINDPSYPPTFNGQASAPPLPGGGLIPPTSPFYTGGKYPPPFIMTPDGPVFLLAPQKDPSDLPDEPTPLVPQWKGFPYPTPPGYHGDQGGSEPPEIGEFEPNETPANYGIGIRVFPPGLQGFGVGGAFGPMTDKPGGYEGSLGIYYTADDYEPGWFVRHMVKMFSAALEDETK